MIFGIAIGIVAILIGLKGFTAQGLPLTRKTKLKGTTAQVVGVLCICLGLACLAASIYPFALAPH